MNLSSALSILIAEDEENDVFFLERAFKAAGMENERRFVPDGEDVLRVIDDLLKEPGRPLPGLIVLDLNMRRMGGLEVLKWLRARSATENIPVVVFSSSSDQNEIDLVYAAGANAYVIKPASLTERNVIARFFKDWLALVRPPCDVASIGGRAALWRPDLVREP